MLEKEIYLLEYETGKNRITSSTKLNDYSEAVGTATVFFLYIVLKSIFAHEAKYKYFWISEIYLYCIIL